MNDLVPPEATLRIDSGDAPVDAGAEQDAEAQAAEPVLNEQQAQLLTQTLHEEQNLLMGALTGFFAAMVGAGIWATVTVVTEYQIGWMAVGIGFFVGFAVRFAGKGIAPVFGAVSAVMALVGCAVGNLMTFTYFIAMSEGLTFMDVVTQLDFAIAFDILSSTFEVMDVLFYGLAAYFGYKYAFRQVTQQDLDKALGKGF